MDRKIISDIGEFIFVSHEPRKADIMFLPGGSDPLPPEHAAELYRQGCAPLLMPSGGISVKRGKWAGVQRKADIYSGDYHSDCEFYTDALRINGVPLSAIIPEDKSGHTRDNAFFSRRVADERGLEIKTAIIVCKSFHARRCFMLYQLAFPEAELIVCPVDVYGITHDNWHTTKVGTERVLGELARCGNQFVGDIMEYLGFGEQ
ncbi:MAG: YdcF family protein [Oscillospiraceae bacterium]|nr:YdcF family protein [Oscillospiraceae bacterium]